MIIAIWVTLVVLVVAVISVGRGLIPWCEDNADRQMLLLAVPWGAFTLEILIYIFQHCIQ